MDDLLDEMRLALHDLSRSAMYDRDCDCDTCRSIQRLEGLIDSLEAKLKEEK